MIPGNPEAPYSVGSNHWPGASKVIEEAGETIQVLGKLVAIGGRTDVSHWDGTNLGERLIEELGDLHAALAFLIDVNDLDWAAINARQETKRERLWAWHAGHDVDEQPAPDSEQLEEGEIQERDGHPLSVGLRARAGGCVGWLAGLPEALTQAADELDALVVENDRKDAGIATARRRVEGLLDRVTFVEGLPRDAVALLDNLLDGLAALQARTGRGAGGDA